MVIGLLRYLTSFNRNQWKDPSELRIIQGKKLRKMIFHAYRRVPYYKKMFDSIGIEPNDIHSVNDLQKIPISTRRDYQRLPIEEITAKGISYCGCKRITTSGSSGMPLTILLRNRDSDIYDMIWARALREIGQKFFDKSVALKFHATPNHRWFQRLGIWRKDIISILDEEEAQLKSLKEFSPQILKGNPFDLILLAKSINKKSLQLPSLRLLLTRGSYLDPADRNFIGDVFKAEVFDQYAATEFGLIAWECKKHEGYHTNSDSVILEVCNDNGEPVKSGEMGRLICTALHSFAMPFIRHDTGDVGVLSDRECSCGMSLLPILARIEGRVEDFLIKKNGNFVSPSLIINQTKSVRGIEHFKIIQDESFNISVLVVRGKDFADQRLNDFQNILTKILGNDLSIRIKTVDRIPREESGKWRAIVSKANP